MFMRMVNQQTNAWRMAGWLSLLFLRPYVCLCPSAAEGLSERSSREVWGRLQSTAFVCTGLCGKMRWCCTDMALDPARKQTKQMY